MDLKCLINRSYLQPDRKAVVFVSADVKAADSGGAPGEEASSCLNVCMAIDCSGSMQGEKLQTAKEAAVRIVDLLRPADYISVVRFADEANVTVPRQRAQNKKQVQSEIRNMRQGNSTAMYDGIRQANAQLVSGGLADATAVKSELGVIGGIKKLLGQPPPQIPSSGSSKEAMVSRLILLTDGQPTKGPTDESSFVSLSRELRNSGVSVTAMGIGDDYNEDLLTKIASTSGGKWDHVTDVRRLPQVFEKELDDMKTVMLVKPELHIHLASGAELSDIYRVGTMVTKMTDRDYGHSANDYNIPLEDVRRGQMSKVVFKVHVPPKPNGQYRIAKVTLAGPTVELTKDVIVEFTQDQSRWQLEDPLPRVSLDIIDATVIARSGVGNPTISRQAKEKVETVMKDPNSATVIKGEPGLANMAQTVVRVADQTIVRGQAMSEEEKKELKGQTTVIKK